MSGSIGRRVGTLSKVIADLTGPLGDRVRWGLPESSIIAELLQEGAPWLDPASYVTTGSHDTFELRVRAHGRSPTSSFLLCSLFSNALGLRSHDVSRFPPLKGMGSSGEPLPYAIHSVRDPTTARLASVA